MDGSSLEQRVAALERQNRRLKACVGIIAALVSVPVLAAATSTQTADVLRANRFEVVGNGKVVAQIAADENGGLIRIWHTSGSAAVTLSAKALGGGSMTVWDSESRRAGYLAAGPWGGSLDISKRGETVGYFDAVRAGVDSVGAALCVGKTADGCSYRIPGK